MGEKQYEDNEIVVDTAKIVCTYANNDIQSIRIYHTHGEKQNGSEIAHNHDCKINNLPVFKTCLSPYYKETVEKLHSLFPDNTIYSNAYSVILATTTHPDYGYTKIPCIMAVLDSWFDSSDIVISDDFSELCKVMDKFKTEFNSKLKELKDYIKKELEKKINDLNKKIPVANSSNATKKEDVRSQKQIQADWKEINRLTDLKESMNQIFDDRNVLINTIENYWEAIETYDDGYAENLLNVGKVAVKYANKWKDLVVKIPLDINNEKIKSFYKYIDNITREAQSIGDWMLNWEENKDEAQNTALLMSSFLICRCGGKITFAKNGQNHTLYCQKLYVKFLKLIQDASAYLKVFQENNSVYAGVTFDESNVSVDSAIVSLDNIKNAFDTNSDFKLDSGTMGGEIRFITKGYKKEKAKRTSAMIGMIVLTPIALAGAVASPGVAAGISCCLWAYDAYSILSQSEEEAKENEGGDLITVVNDMASVGSSAYLIYEGTNYKAATKIAKATKVGYATIAISFINSFSNMFYTSEDDWVEEIKITVFTPYMAHIITQHYTEEVEESTAFVGLERVTGKTKVDYGAESIRLVDWDNIDGLTMGIQKDIGDEKETYSPVDNPSGVKDRIRNGTNGEN